ncbi:MAG: hypothetical protein JWM20_691 [Patescibacteria group bacterium]|nr:hypothetical protein [Patescibacteria group bacterium]
MDIADYLKKFSGSLPREAKVRNAVISSLKEILNIELDRDKIKVSKETVFIMANSALRSEISMKQEKILESINNQDPELKIKKIQ